MERDENDKSSVKLDLKNTNIFLKELAKISRTVKNTSMTQNNIVEGTILDGQVTKISKFGAFISLPGDKLGLVHISEISDNYIQNIEDFLNVGKTVKVKVLRVNTRDNKIDLSIKQVVNTVDRQSKTVTSKSIISNGNSVTREIPDNAEQQQHRMVLPKIAESNDISVLKNVRQPTERDEFGRVKNAEQCPFRFVPHTVIRPLDMDKDSTIDKDPKNSDKAKLMKIVNLMSAGKISSFEISLLYWIARLKFSNRAMLTDLLRGAFIDRTRVVNTNLKDLMQNKLTLLFNYNLINRAQFLSLDESGQDIVSKGTFVYLLNKIGGTTLTEIGMTDVKYNAFDILQDGNTVKKIMATNQWLIFMLTHFPKEAIGENFETSNVFHLMADEHYGARFLGTVVCNNETLVGEAVRRVEDFEMHTHKNFLREKFERFIKIFNKFTEIYIKRNNGGRDKFIIPKRPILVYICEDDKHINEVYSMLSDTMNRNPEQEIWFTTDLRIFNSEMMNQRFLKKDHNRRNIIVNLKKRLNVQESIISKLTE